MIKKVNICGIPHEIIYCKDSFDIDTHLGMICYKDCEIRINEDMPEEHQKETICHEMLHGILNHLGFSNLSSDEQFVQSLGNAIYNSFEIKDLNSEKEN